MFLYRDDNQDRAPGPRGLNTAGMGEVHPNADFCTNVLECAHLKAIRRSRSLLTSGARVMLALPAVENQKQREPERSLVESQH
jgi:hypothetical protein